MSHLCLVCALIVLMSGFRFTKKYMIDASSEDTIANSFTNIGVDLGIENPDTAKVLTKLKQLKENWLLLFDNADNTGLHLANFFPQSKHGNIIITTCNASLESLSPDCCIGVSTLDEEVAIQLFLKKSRVQNSEENTALARTLVNEFGCLALAIVQAGSYIASQKITLTKYIELYQNDSAQLLSITLGQDINYRSPVFKTWEISYNCLTDMAKTVLNICSYLYRGRITKDPFFLAATSSEAINMLHSKISDQENGDNRPSPALCSLLKDLCYPGGGWNDIQFTEIMNSLC